MGVTMSQHRYSVSGALLSQLYYNVSALLHYTDYGDDKSELWSQRCYCADMLQLSWYFMILSTGVHPVLFVVHLWEKGFSHRPEPVLRRTERLHLTSGRGLNYTQALTAIFWL